MRTAAICPTCATYINAACIIYNGPNLLNINTLTLDNLEDILGNINTTVGGINTSISGINTSITTINGNITTLTTNLALKEDTANKSNDGTLSANSPILFPTQQAVKTYTDGLVVGLLDDRGNFTPSPTSPGPYPSTGGSGTGGAIMKGDIWFIDANGYLGTTAVNIGASVRALVDNPTTSADWDILDANLGFIPENVANKVTTAADVIAFATSTVKYPAVKAIKDYVDNLVSTSISAVNLATVLATGNTANDETITLYGNVSGTYALMYGNGSNAYFRAAGPSGNLISELSYSGVGIYNTTTSQSCNIDTVEIIYDNGTSNTQVTSDPMLYSNNIITYPSGSGYFVLSVNGQTANSAGDITLSNNILTSKISVTSAELLNIGSVPKLLVAGQGVGKVIRLMDASIAYNHNTIAYSSTQLRFTLGGIAIAANSALALSSTGIAFNDVPAVNLTAAQSNNQGLYLTAAGNPTLGNGTIDVFITYQVITL